MVAFTSIALATTTFLGLTAAAPHSKRDHPVIHRIYAGSTVENGGLHFEPQNLVAMTGEYVEVHFLAKNHTIVQSSFDKPCEPLADGAGFFSGFNFATSEGTIANGEAIKVFTFEVQNEDPIWFYCSQPNGEHCKAGMSGVINQNFNSDKTLAAYKEKAKTAVVQQPSPDFRKSQGGKIEPNYPL
ncbi:hypothetical protein K458DRAFT_417034 [Lentithecium fluviatile CBS 122367]|uniref:Cupredoxin n=1 Tax=Lentithecium fluviatile CBS 122367 TaxID=1168545 RepID=A0A6G1J5Y6_9PLEO|nr:hypothetical protein K458DRAFT_417034 [Lentithecium fluviatile CBS 122367]